VFVFVFVFVGQYVVWGAVQAWWTYVRTTAYKLLKYVKYDGYECEWVHTIECAMQ
jgi:hypothetical protein